MSNFVEHIPCPTCNSKDNLAVFEEDGKFNGYCFGKCGYVKDPYQNMPDDYKPVFNKKSPEEIARELYEIYKYPIVNVNSRSLTADTLTHFGVRVGISQSDGETPSVLYFPYTRNSEVVAYKAKLLDPKKIWSHGDQKGVDPFGWDLALSSDSPKLIITEGEADAMALYQMIKDSNKGSE